MKSLFVVFLALTATTTAVEAKGQTKKRGLEEAALGYAQQNHAFPLGGPLDLGSIQGIELKSFESLGNSLGSGQYGFGGAQYHGLNSYLGYGGLQTSGLGVQNSYGYPQGYGLGTVGAVSPSVSIQASGLGVQNGYAYPQGYGLGTVGAASPSASIQPSGLGVQNGYGYSQGNSLGTVGAASPPVSIPQVVPPAIAIPQSQGRQFGAKVAIPAEVPTSAPIPPTAFPPTQGIPQPVLPPAPLQAYPSAPASAPASVPAPAPAPEPISTTTAAAQTPAPAPAPASPNAASEAGRLGSGSLGYTNLGNGLFALGSGSLGYTSSSNPSQSNQVQQVQQVQQPQQNLGYGDLQNLGLYAQLGQDAGYAAQNLPLNLGYNSQQLGGAELYGQVQYNQEGPGPKYTSTFLPGQAQGYGTFPGGLYYGSQQVQSVGFESGYGGYGINNERSGVGQAILSSGLSGLNLGYGGNIGGYASGVALNKGY